MDEDLKLRLLSGMSIKIDKLCEIKPYTLKEIVEIGYNKFNNYLLNIILEPKDFYKDVVGMDLENITTFDVIIGNIIYSLKNNNYEYINFIQDAFSLFLREEVKFALKNNNEVFFIIGESSECRQINKDNFNEIKQILKIINCLDKEKKEEYNPGNSKAEEIKQKILMARKIRSKQNNNEITIFDLISCFSANSNNTNILQIWDLTLFQFNDQFARMRMIEDYDIGIRSLLAGAKSEDIKLKYYVRPIQDEDDTKEGSDLSSKNDKDIIKINFKGGNTHG